MNTRNSTEAELVAANDIIEPMVWTRSFLEAQGYLIQANVLFEDNKIVILLKKMADKVQEKSLDTPIVNLFHY